MGPSYRAFSYFCLIFHHTIKEQIFYKNILLKTINYHVLYYVLFKNILYYLQNLFYFKNFLKVIIHKFYDKGL